jgi:hypothetical protein
MLLSWKAMNAPSEKLEGERDGLLSPAPAKVALTSSRSGFWDQ